MRPETKPSVDKLFDQIDKMCERRALFFHIPQDIGQLLQLLKDKNSQTWRYMSDMADMKYPSQHSNWNQQAPPIARGEKS